MYALRWLMTAWRAWRPRAQLHGALEKRRLERVCQAHGCSRAQSKRISFNYFAGGDK